jgi:hypothetical protein
MHSKGLTTHAHEDDVVEGRKAALAHDAEGEKDLRQDLVRRQLPHEAHFARRAEGACPIAAHLRGPARDTARK